MDYFNYTFFEILKYKIEFSACLEYATETYELKKEALTKNVSYLKNNFDDNPDAIWQTNVFGKSLHDLVSEGLSTKLVSMPKEAQGKMRKTLTRIVNENRGGVICILL